MKWLWNNNLVLIQLGAAILGLGFVCAFLTFLGFGVLFHIAYLGSFTVGGISFFCGAILFCLRFGARSDPQKVIYFSLFAQALLLIPAFLLHDRIDFYLRLYGPL